MAVYSYTYTLCNVHVTGLRLGYEKDNRQQAERKKHSLKNKTGSCYLAHTTSRTILQRVASILSHYFSNDLHKLQLPPFVKCALCFLLYTTSLLVSLLCTVGKLNKSCVQITRKVCKAISPLQQCWIRFTSAASFTTPPLIHSYVSIHAN